MTKFLVALPAPAGIEDDLDAFSREVEVRFDEFRDSRSRLGVMREAAWMQNTPAGDLLLLLLEAADPVAANEQFAASTDEFDVWFKDRAGGILSVDLHQPIPVHPEPIYTSAPEGPGAEQSVAFAVPLVPGRTEEHRQMGRDVQGERQEGFDAFHDHAGIREDWWIQETPMGDLGLVYLESDDLGSAIGHLAQSQDETEVWFKQTMLENEGIDWSGPPPPLPRPVFDWRP